MSWASDVLANQSPAPRSTRSTDPSMSSPAQISTSISTASGDSAVSDRYDVGPIPHTVVIDRSGVVRKVVRGGKLDLEREISGL